MKGNRRRSRYLRATGYSRKTYHNPKGSDKCEASIEICRDELEDKLRKKVKKEEALLHGENHGFDIIKQPGHQEIGMPELNENLHILENIQLKLNIDKQGKTQPLIINDSFITDGSKNALEPVEGNRDFLLQRNLISVSRNEKDQEQSQGEYPKEEELEIIAGRECIGTEQNDEKLVEVAENNELSQPVKRKRGRPKGSKNNNVSDGSLSQAIPGAAEKRKSTRIPRELKSIMSGSDLKLPPTRERRKNDPLKQATKILPQKNEENEAASQSQASEDQANSTSAATKKRGPKKKEFISESESSNNVASEDSKQEQTSESVAMPRNGLKDKRTFINCDIRYFNLDFLVEQLGSFDSKTRA